MQHICTINLVYICYTYTIQVHNLVKGDGKMKLLVANDNGNSEHKIIIDGELYKQPNVYSILYTAGDESEESLDDSIKNLHNNIVSRIESKSIPGEPRRYLIGAKVLSTQSTADQKNMDVYTSVKHKEELPIINTLSLLAAVAVQKQYASDGNIENGQTIKVNVDMITALPASYHKAESEKMFKGKFDAHLHEVKIFINEIAVNVQIEFDNVKVLKEGVPALFGIIEDGKGNYRNDSIFADFMKDYEHQDLDGSYFLNKKMLHVDIGDGTTELTVTEGYKADSMRSHGEKYGLGQALEKGAIELSEKLNDFEVKRQQISEYLKDKKHKFHKVALDSIESPKQDVARQLLQSIEKRLKNYLRYEVDIIVVYGGASILLKDKLYEELKNQYKDYGIEVLWIPEEFATTMNAVGMNMYLDILLEQSK